MQKSLFPPPPPDLFNYQSFATLYLLHLDYGCFGIDGFILPVLFSVPKMSIFLSLLHIFKCTSEVLDFFKESNAMK